MNRRSVENTIVRQVETRRLRHCVGIITFLLVMGFVLSSGFSIRASELPPDKDDAPLVILGHDALGELASQNTDAIFRVDHRDDSPLWMPRATAFAIHQAGNRLLLVTNAHVIEQETDGETLDLKPESLRIVQRGHGRELNVVRLFKHPRRERGMGPDVAMLEARISGSREGLPVGLRLLPRDVRPSLLGRAVGLLGFPSMDGVKLTQPFFGGGVVAQEHDDDQHLVYSLVADHGSSGSPVFIAVRDTDPLSGRSAIREFVVGVHNRRHGDQLRGGMHIDAVWDLIAHHKISLDDKPAFSPSPNDRPIAGRGRTDRPSVPNVDPAFVEHAGAEQPQNPTFETSEFADITQLAERGQYDEAAQKLAIWMKARQERRQAMPWELHCLAGAIATRRGWQFDDAGDERNARTQFASAIQSLERAVELEPDEGLPMLLLARVQANLGRPSSSTANAGDRNLLQAVHDSIGKWLLLKSDKLSKRDQAQANFLLGYVHRHLPCGTTEKVRGNFTESMKLFPSKQGFDWFQRIVTGTANRNEYPDLWDEFSQLTEAQAANSK